MGFIEYDVDDIVKKLEKWKPDGCETEKHFEADLYSYLNECFPKEIIQKQYAYAKTKCDLFLSFKGGAKIAIEVKAMLKDRNAYHRLIGQIWTYFSEWKKEVLIVLCGECDPALLKSTLKFAKYLNDNSFIKVRIWPK